MSGNWGYSYAGSASSNDSNFIQGYTIDFGQQLTEAMDYTANLAYRHSWEEQSGSSDSMAPSISVALRNDLFQMHLSGTALESTRPENGGQSNRAWETAWSSGWQKKYWPQVRVSYGQDFQKNNNGSEDRQTSNLGANADWDFGRTRMYYSFSHNEETDDVRVTNSRSTGHFARLETAATFLDNRASVSFSQNFSRSYSKFEGQVTGGEGFLLKLNAPPPLIMDSVNSALIPPFVFAPDAGLADGDITTAVSSIAFGDTYDAVLLVQPQVVDVLYVYTAAALTAPVDLSGWSLSFTDAVTNPWTAAVIDAISYNDTEHRFEITISSLQRNYVRLELNPSSAAFDVTEIEAYRLVTGSGNMVSEEGDSTTYLTDLHLGYRFSPQLHLSYSLSYENASYSPNIDSLRLSQSSSLQWEPNRIWSTTLSFSESTSEITDTENKSRVYSLGINSYPLATLGFFWGISRYESYQDGGRTNTGHSLNFSSNADLYKDLYARLDLSFITNKNEATSLDTDVYTVNFNLTSRFTPRFTVDFLEQYTYTMATKNEASGSHTINLSWRISDLLYASSNAGYLWADGRSSTTTAGMGFALTPTTKTNVNFNYSYAEGTVRTGRTTIHTYNLGCNWSISRYLSFQATSSYSDTVENDIWRIYLQLSARFSGF
jgi:hypothetical protein